MPDGPTYDDVAAWMAQQLDERGSLNQRDAVEAIEKNFGDEFVYTNDNGNPAIHSKVLSRFRKLTADTAVWDRWSFTWDKRTERHAPGRKQE